MSQLLVQISCVLQSNYILSMIYLCDTCYILVNCCKKLRRLFLMMTSNCIIFCSYFTLILEV